MRLQPHWLKKSVLLPVALAMIVTSTLLLVLLLAVLSQGAKQEFERDLAVARTHWDNQLARRAGALRALGELVKTDAPLAAALTGGDALSLGRAAAPLFARLQQDYGISSLTLVNADGRVLLGLHHPAVAGEAMQSAVLQRAMAGDAAQAGLEIDQWNTLRMLGASPWRQGDRLLGYVVLGQAFEMLAGELDGLFAMRHLIALPAQHPDTQQLTLLPASLQRPPVALLRLLHRDRVQELEQGVALERADKWYFAGTIPLADTAGTPLGWLVTLRDVSDVRATLLLSATFIALVTVAILALLLLFLHRITQQAERRLEESERERQHTLEQLETSHAEWVESFDAIEQPIFLHDDRFRVTRANRAYAERAGMSFHDLLGRPYWEVFPRNGGPLPGCARAMEGGRDRNEEQIRLADGSVYVSRSFPVRDDNGEYRFSIHVLQDVTALEQVSTALQHEMRARRTLSASHLALLHADTEEGLLQEVCRIAAEAGGYPLAWAAYKNDDAQCSLRPVGAAGIGLEELAQWPLSCSEPAAQQLLSACAIHSGETQVVQDLQHDDTFPHSQALARRHGYASAAAFPLRTGSEVLGVLFIAAATPHAFSAPELDILRELAVDLSDGIAALRARLAHARVEQERLDTLERLKNLLGNTVLALSSAVEARVPYTAGHQQRVMELAVSMGRELGWDRERIETLGIAALLHDVGNIAVPAEVLGKADKLSAEEYALVRNHSQAGHKILGPIDLPWSVAEMVLQHHEMLDGSGYPSGLKGGSILPEAQIIGIACMVEAIASHRPYRPALGISAALEQLERHRGGKFDAQLVDACLHLFRHKGYRLEHHGQGLSAL